MESRIRLLANLYGEKRVIEAHLYWFALMLDAALAGEQGDALQAQALQRRLPPVPQQQHAMLTGQIRARLARRRSL